jgi:S-adenosylmethionine:tRNA ribosyltransferase-isomerase
VDDLNDHTMHFEEFEVSHEAVVAIEETRRRGGRVVAIGTTVVRALESAKNLAKPGHVVALSQSTNLLIQPGYVFSVVDALWTNFHQPKSTLLALVSAFAGIERTRAAYSSALSLKYKFLSYGDAMWIPQPWAGAHFRNHIDADRAE